MLMIIGLLGLNPNDYPERSSKNRINAMLAFFKEKSDLIISCLKMEMAASDQTQILINKTSNFEMQL